jgi:hypothetical protein
MESDQSLESVLIPKLPFSPKYQSWYPNGL